MKTLSRALVALLIGSLILGPAEAAAFQTRATPIPCPLSPLWTTQALTAPYALSMLHGQNRVGAALVRARPTLMSRTLWGPLLIASILSALSACVTFNPKNTPTIDPLAGEDRNDRFAVGTALVKKGLDTWHVSPKGPLQLSSPDFVVDKVIESRAVADKAAGGISTYLRALSAFAVDYKWATGVGGPYAAFGGKGAPEYSDDLSANPMLQGMLYFYPLETSAGYGWKPRGIWNSVLSILNGSTFTDKNTIAATRLRALGNLAEAQTNDASAQQEFLDSVRVAWHRQLQVAKTEFDLDAIQLAIAARKQVLLLQRRAKSTLNGNIQQSTEAEPALAALSRELDQRRWFRDSVATTLSGQLSWTPEEAALGLEPIARYRAVPIATLSELTRRQRGADTLSPIPSETLWRALQAKFKTKFDARSTRGLDVYSAEGERALLELLIPGYKSSLIPAPPSPISVEDLTRPLSASGFAVTPAELALNSYREGVEFGRQAVVKGMKPSYQFSIYSLLASVGKPLMITGGVTGAWPQDMSQSQVREQYMGALGRQAEIRTGDVQVRVVQGHKEAEARRQAALARAFTAYQAIARNSNLLYSGLRAPASVSVDLITPSANIAIAQRQAASAVYEAEQALRQATSYQKDGKGSTPDLVARYNKHRAGVTKQLLTDSAFRKLPVITEPPAESTPAQRRFHKGLLKGLAMVVMPVLGSMVWASQAAAMTFSRAAATSVRVTVEQGDNLSSIAIKVLRAINPEHVGNFSASAIKEMYTQIASKGGFNPHHLSVGQSFDVQLLPEAATRLAGELPSVVQSVTAAAPTAPVDSFVQAVAESAATAAHSNWEALFQALSGWPAVAIASALATAAAGYYFYRRSHAGTFPRPRLWRFVAGIWLVFAGSFLVIQTVAEKVFASSSEAPIEEPIEEPTPVAPPASPLPARELAVYAVGLTESGKISQIGDDAHLNPGDVLVGWKGSVSAKSLRNLSDLNRRWRKLGFKNPLVDPASLERARRAMHEAAKAPIQIRSNGTRGSVDSRFSYSLARLRQQVSALEQARAFDAYNQMLDPDVPMSLDGQFAASIARPLGDQISGLLVELTARHVVTTYSLDFEKDSVLLDLESAVASGSQMPLFRLPGSDTVRFVSYKPAPALDQQRRALAEALEGYQRLRKATAAAQKQNPIAGAEFEIRLKDAGAAVRTLERVRNDIERETHSSPSGLGVQRQNMLPGGPLTTLWALGAWVASLLSKLRRRKDLPQGPFRLSFSA